MPLSSVVAPIRSSEQDTERNRLLRAIPPPLHARLGAEAEPVELLSKQSIWAANAAIRSIYFPRSCVISLVVSTGDDLPVEAATVGNEGFAGVPVALGASSTSITAMTQVRGEALRVSAEFFRSLMAEEGFRLVMLAYASSLLDQTAQTVACNRRHDLVERCARWLLMTHDRVGREAFGLTQAFLATMLAVRRPSVTVAAGTLARAGLIRYSRGRVEVLDREGLEAASCECYQIGVDSYARSLNVA